jgi:signal peptidase II
MTVLARTLARCWPAPAPRYGVSVNPSENAAPGRIRVRVLMFAVAVVVVAADQVSKALVLAHLPADAHVRLLGGLVTLELLFNSGMAFSLGTSYTVIIALIACAAVFLIIRTARELRSPGWAAALGLLLGGAAGNLADRLFRAPGPFRGAVVDWIHLSHFPWTFNVADAAITCSAVLIALLTLRGTGISGRP